MSIKKCNGFRRQNEKSPRRVGGNFLRRLSDDVLFNFADKSVVRFAEDYIFWVGIFCYNVFRLKILIHLLEVNLFAEEKFISLFESDSVVEEFGSYTGRGDFIHISAGLKAEYFVYLVEFFGEIRNSEEIVSLNEVESVAFGLNEREIGIFTPNHTDCAIHDSHGVKILWRAGTDES